MRTSHPFFETKLTIMAFKEDCKTIQNTFFKKFFEMTGLIDMPRKSLTESGLLAVLLVLGNTG